MQVHDVNHAGRPPREPPKTSGRDGAWVQVHGECEVLDAFVEYFRTIAGEHPDWDEYRRAMVEQGTSLLRITPTSWGPVATGGFPAHLA